MKNLSSNLFKKQIDLKNCYDFVGGSGGSETVSTSECYPDSDTRTTDYDDNCEKISTCETHDCPAA